MGLLSSIKTFLGMVDARAEKKGRKSGCLGVIDCGGDKELRSPSHDSAKDFRLGTKPLEREEEAFKGSMECVSNTSMLKLKTLRVRTDSSSCRDGRSSQEDSSPELLSAQTSTDAESCSSNAACPSVPKRPSTAGSTSLTEDLADNKNQMLRFTGEGEGPFNRRNIFLQVEKLCQAVEHTAKLITNHAPAEDQANLTVEQVLKRLGLYLDYSFTSSWSSICTGNHSQVVVIQYMLLVLLHEFVLERRSRENLCDRIIKHEVKFFEPLKYIPQYMRYSTLEADEEYLKRMLCGLQSLLRRCYNKLGTDKAACTDLAAQVGDILLNILACHIPVEAPATRQVLREAMAEVVFHAYKCKFLVGGMHPWLKFTLTGIPMSVPSRVYLKMVSPQKEEVYQEVMVQKLTVERPVVLFNLRPGVMMMRPVHAWGYDLDHQGEKTTVLVREKVVVGVGSTTGGQES